MTKRVGHRGAHAVVRGNTLGSFEAALDLGVDMIEFDVCAVRGRLGIAHNPLEGRLLGCLPLDAGLAHLATPRFDGIELNVDLKHAGCERGALEALRAPRPARALAHLLAPAGRARPRARARAGGAHRPVGRRAAGAAADRAARLARGSSPDALAAGRFQALMAHHRLVDRELVDARQGRGRGALRVDGRREPADRPPHRARGHGHHHERPAAVRRPARRQRA